MSSARRSTDYVDRPEPADVLFGRGSGPNDHDGNILFRSLVKERKAAYMATNHRQTKANIANAVVEAIRAQNGRFLKKAEGRDLKRLGLPEESEVWCFVDEKHILEKAKQALRQKGDMKDQDDAKAPALPDKKAAPAAGASSATKKSAPPPVPSEAVSYYGHEHPTMQAPAVMPDVYGSGDLPVTSNQDIDWRTYGGNQELIPGHMPRPPTQQGGQYMQHPAPYSSQAHLPEEVAPDQRYSNVQAQPAHFDRISEQHIHSAAAAGYPDEQVPVGDGPEDDERRKSLQVEDLMRSFHRMGTDEMQTSSSDNISSNDTMGTIEPLPMNASNQSMMTSSTFSILKGAFDDTVSPRGSITRPANYSKRDTSTSTGSKNDSSDMSLSFSNLEGMWGDSGDTGTRSGNQVSQVIEGEDEGASNDKLTEEPRPMHLMEEDPDSFPRFGSSSMNILKATLGESGDTTGSSPGKASTKK